MQHIHVDFPPDARLSILIEKNGNLILKEQQFPESLSFQRVSKIVQKQWSMGDFVSGFPSRLTKAMLLAGEESDFVDAWLMDHFREGKMPPTPYLLSEDKMLKVLVFAMQTCMKTTTGEEVTLDLSKLDSLAPFKDSHHWYSMLLQGLKDSYENMGPYLCEHMWDPNVVVNTGLAHILEKMVTDFTISFLTNNKLYVKDEKAEHKKELLKKAVPPAFHKNFMSFLKSETQTLLYEGHSAFEDYVDTRLVSAETIDHLYDPFAQWKEDVKYQDTLPILVFRVFSLLKHKVRIFCRGQTGMQCFGTFFANPQQKETICMNLDKVVFSLMEKGFAFHKLLQDRLSTTKKPEQPCPSLLAAAPPESSEPEQLQTQEDDAAKERHQEEEAQRRLKEEEAMKMLEEEKRAEKELRRKRHEENEKLRLLQQEKGRKGEEIQRKINERQHAKQQEEAQKLLQKQQERELHEQERCKKKKEKEANIKKKREEEEEQQRQRLLAAKAKEVQKQHAPSYKKPLAAAAANPILLTTGNFQKKDKRGAAAASILSNGETRCPLSLNEFPPLAAPGPASKIQESLETVSDALLLRDPDQHNKIFGLLFPMMVAGVESVDSNHIEAVLEAQPMAMRQLLGRCIAQDPSLKRMFLEENFVDAEKVKFQKYLSSMLASHLTQDLEPLCRICSKAFDTNLYFPMASSAHLHDGGECVICGMCWAQTVSKEAHRCPLCGIPNGLHDWKVRSGWIAQKVLEGSSSLV